LRLWSAEARLRISAARDERTFESEICAKLRASSIVAVFEVHPKPFEEETDGSFKALGDLKQATRAHPVRTGLVLLDLLVGDIERLGELFLGEPKHGPPFADQFANLAIDAGGVARAAKSKLVHGGRSSRRCSLANAKPNDADLILIAGAMFVNVCV
jgi:hypothetical protein